MPRPLDERRHVRFSVLRRRHGQPAELFLAVAVQDHLIRRRPGSGLGEELQRVGVQRRHAVRQMWLRRHGLGFENRFVSKRGLRNFYTNVKYRFK